MNIKILFFSAGPELVASSRTRVYQYLPYLDKRGVRARVINYISSGRCRKNLAMAGVSLIGRIMDKARSWAQTILVMLFAPGHDILFIQKVLLPKGALDLLSALNPRIIFDFDDAIYLADTFARPRRRVFLDRFNHTLSVSKYVIVENKQNEAYARKFNPKTAIITGPIDTSLYVPKDISKNSGPGAGDVTIGWIGSPETTKYIAAIAGVFTALSKQHKNLKLSLIGSSYFRPEGVNVVMKEWALGSELEDLQSFDIGIMPLEDDEWSRGKGGYKLLQYMAVGIPCVASPVGINAEIIQDGVTGYLAVSEEIWFDRLSRLIKDKDLREKMGSNGRARAESTFSFEVSAPRLIGIFRDCIGAGV